MNWEALDWSLSEGVTRITMTIEHHGDKVVASMEYDTGRKDMLVFVKQVPQACGVTKEE